MGALDTLLFSLAVLSNGGQEAAAAPASARYDVKELKGQWQPYTRAMVQGSLEAMPEPKMSPNTKWTYPFLTVGYGRRSPDSPYFHRFRVFSQSADMQTKLGIPTSRLLMRLWDIVVNRFWRDHEERILHGAIDVYLTKEGLAGGEQVMTNDRNQTITTDPFTTSSDGKAQRVNVIYLYQVEQKIPTIERVRETAHEYGHATLPPVGSFSSPESWINGDFGERVFLRWIRDGLAKGAVSPDDVLGVTAAELDGYLAKEYLPLVRKGAFEGPSEKILKQKDKAAYDSWLGTALWVEAILPAKIFARALNMGVTQTPDPYGLPAGIVEGVSDFPKVDVTLPDWAVGKKVWLPLGKGQLSGGSVQSRLGDGWALVTAAGRQLSIANPKAPSPK